MFPNTIVKPVMFNKYIGVKSISVPKFPKCHFIMALAVEERKGNGKGTGKFNPSWNVKDFSADKIIKLKKEYENVKVVISIGGHGTSYSFNPQDKQKWIENAKKSLEKIIEHDYKSITTTKVVIDGIDITYEHIESGEFVECIVEVIKYLKNKGLKVSISLFSYPSDSLDHVFFIYKNLYEGNKHLIDWVDYNFYTQTISTTDSSVRLSDCFRVQRLLAGFSTDPNNIGNILLDVPQSEPIPNRSSMPGNPSTPAPKHVPHPTSASKLRTQTSPMFGNPPTPAPKHVSHPTSASKLRTQTSPMFGNPSTPAPKHVPHPTSASKLRTQTSPVFGNPPTPAPKHVPHPTSASKLRTQTSQTRGNPSTNASKHVPHPTSVSKLRTQTSQTRGNPSTNASKPVPHPTTTSKLGSQQRKFGIAQTLASKRKIRLPIASKSRIQ